MYEIMLGFLHSSSTISILVLCWLAFYLFLTLWVFFYRYMILGIAIKGEKQALKMLISKEIDLPKSAKNIEGIVGGNVGKEILHIWKQQILQNASKGLTVLGIVASTAPFIGLFGTVVEILEAFFQLGGGGKVAFDTVAPIISKALVATAAGILTAIPAYSFHLILKRRLYDLNVLLQMELDFLISKKETQQQIRF